MGGGEGHVGTTCCKGCPAGVVQEGTGRRHRNSAVPLMFTTLIVFLLPPLFFPLFLGKMWIGGCQNQANSGWHYYCLNRELYNTGGGYLRKATNTRFAAQRAGYFRVNFCKALDLASLPLRHHLWAFLVTYSLAHVHLTSSGASRLPPLTALHRALHSSSQGPSSTPAAGPTMTFTSKGNASTTRTCTPLVAGGRMTRSTILSEPVRVDYGVGYKIPCRLLL